MRLLPLSGLLLALLAAIGLLSCAGPSHGRADAGAADASIGSLDAGRSDAGTTDDAGTAPGTPAEHRPEAMACPATRSSDVPDGGWGVNLDAGNGCETDQDCVDGGPGLTNGRCGYSGHGLRTACSWDECTQDSDCADGGVCACRNAGGNSANLCVPADCHVDADCGDGGFCSPSPGGCFPYVGVEGYYCHTPEDRCENTSECRISTLFCVFTTTTDPHWACGPLDCSG